MRRTVGLAFAFVFCLAATLQATEVVIVGSHVLLPNTAGQVIDIMVTNDRATTVNLQGQSFYVQVGNGSSGPSINPGDIVTDPGLVFHPNNTGNGDSSGGTPQLIALDTTTSSGFIQQAGNSTVLLGIITVDTTGFFAGDGPWALTMANPDQIGASQVTAWGNVTTPTNPQDPTGSTYIDGSISIVPEPTSVVLGLFAAAGLGVVAIRKRRARRA